MTTITTTTTTTRSVTVAVDANGADLGPSEVAAGAAIAAGQGVRVLVFGAVEAIGPVPDGVTVVDSPISIAKEADPVLAARATPDASIVRAARAVADGEADALVAGGSTGAALAAGVFHIRRDRGIHRPALALTLPVPGGPVTLLDVGANAEVRAEHLVQFGFMGAALAQVVLGVERPRVGLLSNGEEPTKGTPLIFETYAALQERAADSPLVDFVGNLDGTQITEGAADVVVTDGFTGNVALKVLEGASRATIHAVRDAAMSSPRAKIGGLLLRSSLRRLRDDLDPEEAGGAYMLGLRKLGVVPHGRFTRRGISQAILLAARGVTGDVVGRTHAALEAADALRSPSPAAAASDTPTTVRRP